MKNIYKIISILGLLIGYSTNIMAQYGIFEPISRLKLGKVITKDCNENAGRVKMELFYFENDDKEIVFRTFKSKRNGKFEYTYFNSFGYNKNVFLRITPIGNTLLKDTIYPYNIHDSTYVVPYEGIAPCKQIPIILPDTTEPNIETTDSLPILKIDSFSENSTDKNLPLNGEPLPPSDKINIYPNPNNGIFSLEFTETIEQKYLILVYDMTGKQVFTKSIKSKIGKNTVKINTYFLKPATYTLVLQAKNKIATKRYVKK